MFQLCKSSWSLINGLEKDVPCEITEHILSKLSNGIYCDDYTVYYIESSREEALKYLKSYIASFMSKCIAEHEAMLDTARSDWKECR